MLFYFNVYVFVFARIFLKQESLLSDTNYHGRSTMIIVLSPRLSADGGPTLVSFITAI